VPTSTSEDELGPGTLNPDTPCWKIASSESARTVSLRGCRLGTAAQLRSQRGGDSEGTTANGEVESDYPLLSNPLFINGPEIGRHGGMFWLDAVAHR